MFFMNWFPNLAVDLKHQALVIESFFANARSYCDIRILETNLVHFFKPVTSDSTSDQKKNGENEVVLIYNKLDRDYRFTGSCWT